ncbi:MAG: putative endonuclease protein [uncultured bacterium]|nr:MAG: putative endonuclease protein [uncultured bacterium]
MTDWFHIEKDPEHMAREKKKARELKKSNWWHNKLAAGLCHYCGQKFKPDQLNMDHVVPLARGGVSSKSNTVVSCVKCNADKKIMTPVDMILADLAKK